SRSAKAMPTGASATVLRNNVSTCRRSGSRSRASTSCSAMLLSALLITRNPAGFEGHSATAQSAVPIGILRQILLVILLGVIELRRVADFRGNGAVPGGAESGLIRTPRDLGGVPLCLVGHVYRRAVLRTDIASLAHPLRGVMRLPKCLEQVLIPDLRGIVNHPHHLGVPGLAGTDFLVGGIGSEPACIADCGRVDAGELPEEPLHTPEAAHAEYHLAQIGWERRDDAVTIDKVGLRNAEWRSAPGQCLVLVWHYRFLSHVRIFLQMPRGQPHRRDERRI